MFEIGRELMRFFQPEARRDGLCLGDATLLDLIDAELLGAEARTADVAAGRIGARDKPRRLIEAAAVWRELARRTGDPAALRKAASSAEQAAKLARQEGRRATLAAALCEQVQAALVGADLFGDEGLGAAAGELLSDALEAPAVQALQAVLRARRTLADGELEAVRAAAARFDSLVAGSGPAKRRLDSLSRARLRLQRAEFLIGCGARLKDTALVQAALADVDEARSALSSAYQPLVLARALELRGLALTRLGEFDGDLAPLLEALDAFEEGLDLMTPDHSPLDWARLQHGRGLALSLIGEAAESEPAFLQALQAFAAALGELDKSPHLGLRAIAAQDRAACLVRRAEVKGDLFALDEAEAVLRSELAVLRSPPEPLAWAVLQLNLARVYQAQAQARGQDRGERARAADALLAALDVFSERGLRSLTVMAEAGLERLRETSTTA
jgi:tetratricopeptide (TPR) repeat protein